MNRSVIFHLICMMRRPSAASALNYSYSDAVFMHKIIFHSSLFSSEPKILFSYKSQIDEPEDSDVHLPNTSSSGLGRKDLDHGSYSSTQIDGSGAYLDDVVSGPYSGAHSINSIDSDRWRALNA